MTATTTRMVSIVNCMYLSRPFVTPVLFNLRVLGDYVFAFGHLVGVIAVAFSTDSGTRVEK